MPGSTIAEFEQPQIAMAEQFTSDFVKYQSSLLNGSDDEEAFSRLAVVHFCSV
jgi:hypothetical protein